MVYNLNALLVYYNVVYVENGGAKRKDRTEQDIDMLRERMIGKEEETWTGQVSSRIKFALACIMNQKRFV